MSKTSYSKVSQLLFHAYDMRIDASFLDRESLDRLYDALSVYAHDTLKVQKVLVCRDARLSGPSSMQAAIERFSENGLTVYSELHPITTCQFYTSCLELGSVMGVMIGASHNPGRYTGMKVVGPRNIPIAMDIGPEGGLTRIQDLFINGSKPHFYGEAGRIFCIDGRNDYIQDCIRLSQMKEGDLSSLTIVVDALNGSAGTEIMLALQHLGAIVIPRNVVPDGSFPLGPPNPIIEASVAPTMEYLLTNPNYDFCFCFDGDGDRMDVISRGGVSLEPSLIMTFIAPVLKKLYPLGSARIIGFDPKANPQLVTAVEESGLISQLVPNGHSKIKHVITETAGMFAAVEESAHYYVSLPHQSSYVPTESTLLVCLLFLKTWKEQKERYDALVALQNKSFRKREWGYVYADEVNKRTALQAVERLFSEHGYSISKTLPDGSSLGSTVLRFTSETHWACIAQRSSESEAGIARWSVIASNRDQLHEIVSIIDNIASEKASSAY
nr:hypothetical protein [uncultured Sphaerochaeta sp.]